MNTGSGTVALSCYPLAGQDTNGNGILQINSITKSGTGVLQWEWYEVEGSILSTATLTADSIGRVLVEGSVAGPITSAGAITSEIRIGGDLTAPITANGGNIGGPIIVGGTIGASPTQRVNIRAKGTIASITADAIYADINPNFVDANSDGLDDALDGSIANITTRTGDIGSATTPVTIEAFTLIGSITAANVFASIDARTQTTGLDGSLDNFAVTGDLSGTARLGAFTTFRVGRSLLGTIDLPGSALTSTRFIVMNSQNAAGSWKGDVKVGGVTLSPRPQYTQTASSIGGGAVGLVPFFIHGESCSPTDDAVGVATTITSAAVRFYGPVKWASGTTPFTIERRAVGGTYTTLSASCIGTFTGSGTSTATIDLSNVNFANGYQYLIKPATGVLRCDLGGTSDPDVAMDDLEFRVGNACPVDFNGDGTTDNADLSVLLGQFNSGSDPCGKAGDANNDGLCNGADLAILLANFNVVCGSSARFEPGDFNPFESNRSTLNPGSSPSVDEPEQVLREASEAPPQGGSADGLFIINAFGYTSFDAYAAWVNTMTPAEFASHAEVLQGVIAELEAAE